MFNKFFKNQKELKELKKAKKYYGYMKAGTLVLEFIYQDLEKQKRENLNRHQRRRFEKQLQDTGRLNQEIVQYYSTKMDRMVDYVENNLKYRSASFRIRRFLQNLLTKLQPKKPVDVNPMAQPASPNAKPETK